jgi:ArsR family transcriptional regulator, virulence genes transcriptional regulator
MTWAEARDIQGTGQISMQDRMAIAADEAASMLKALSNPSRLLLLCQLVEGEKSVGELEDALELSQAYVSQQLARLRAEGLVAATREGRIVRYRLADGRIAPIIQTIYDQYCPI